METQKAKLGLEKRGSRWTAKEDEELLQQVKTLPIDQIAQLHKRTFNGISLRLAEIAIRLIDEGKSYDEAVKITQASRVDIEKQLRKRTKREQRAATSNGDDKAEIIELRRRLDNLEQKLDLVMKTLKLD